MHNSGGLFGGIIDGFKDIAHIAEFAFVDIVANNLRANFDIETTIQLQKVFTFHLLGGPQSLAGFSVSRTVLIIFQYSLTGLKIAGVFSIGPAIDPTLVLSIKNTQPLTFDMGFDMAVPDGASLNIDIVNVARSSASGLYVLISAAVSSLVSANELNLPVMLRNSMDIPFKSVRRSA